jgi:hypothetical protein
MRSACTSRRLVGDRDFCVTSPSLYIRTRGLQTLVKGENGRFQSIYYGTFYVSTVDAKQKILSKQSPPMS